MKSMKAQFSPRPDTSVGFREFSTFSEAVVIVPHGGGQLENELCPRAGHKILKYCRLFYQLRCNLFPVWGLNRIYDSVFSRLSR